MRVFGLVIGVLALVLGGLYALSHYTSKEGMPSTLTEPEARSIAEHTCIKGGEALKIGFYDVQAHAWMFIANLNATREGCIAVCAVDNVTRKAEVSWKCEKS